MIDTGRTADGVSDDNAWVVFFNCFVDEFGITRYVEFFSAALSVSGCINSDDSAAGFLEIREGFFPTGRIAFPAVNQKDFGVVSFPGVGLEMMLVVLESFCNGVL